MSDKVYCAECRTSKSRAIFGAGPVCNDCRMSTGHLANMYIKQDDTLNLALSDLTNGIQIKSKQIGNRANIGDINGSELLYSLSKFWASKY